VKRILKIICLIPLWYIMICLYSLAIFILFATIGGIFLKTPDEMYGYFIIIAIITGIVSLILSILTIFKVFLRKKDANGIKEKIPKYLVIIMIVVGIIDLITIVFYFITNLLNYKTFNKEEIKEKQNIYTIDATIEQFSFEDKIYVSNEYLSDIRKNHDNHYQVRINNILFNNKDFTFEYSINKYTNEKQISINDNIVKKENIKNESFIGLDIHNNYLIIDEILENERVVSKYYIIDNQGELIYNFMHYGDYIKNTYKNAFEIINDKNITKIQYKTYDLYLNNEVFEVFNYNESTFNCNNFNDESFDIYNEKNEINILKYSYCNAY